VVIKGATPIEVMQGLNELTGPPRDAAAVGVGVPPGTRQRRSGRANRRQVARDTGIPADSVWIDAQDGAVGWEALHISDAEKLVSDLRDSGLRIVPGVPAGVRQLAGEATFDSGTVA
jgi:alpha-glucosidase (family GH31 glycosyl hydrolase)